MDLRTPANRSEKVGGGHAKSNIASPRENTDKRHGLNQITACNAGSEYRALVMDSFSVAGYAQSSSFVFDTGDSSSYHKISNDGTKRP